MSGDAETVGIDRPMRADARRNRERLIAAARDVFFEHGVEATFEEIARRAGVGIGTLYRHFPTRLDLAEAVYQADVDALSLAATAAVGDLPPWDAFESWIQRWVRTAASKRVLFADLADAVGRDSGMVSYCRGVMLDAAELVVGNAQEAGVVRPDIDKTDLLRLVGGLVHLPNPDPAQIERLLPVLLDGLRARD